MSSHGVWSWWPPNDLSGSSRASVAAPLRRCRTTRWGSKTDRLSWPVKSIVSRSRVVSTSKRTSSSAPSWPLRDHRAPVIEASTVIDLTWFHRSSPPCAATAASSRSFISPPGCWSSPGGRMAGAETGHALGDSQALDPPLEGHALGRAPGQRNGAGVVLPGRGVAAGPPFQVSPGRPVERVPGQLRFPGQGGQFAAAGADAVPFGEGQRAIQRHDRAPGLLGENLVEADNPVPVGVLDRRCYRVLAGDAGLQMPAGHVIPGGRAGQVHQAALDVRPVPAAPVLVLEGDEHTVVVEACR